MSQDYGVFLEDLGHALRYCARSCLITFCKSEHFVWFNASFVSFPVWPLLIGTLRSPLLTWKPKKKQGAVLYSEQPTARVKMMMGS